MDDQEQISRASISHRSSAGGGSSSRWQCSAPYRECSPSRVARPRRPSSTPFRALPSAANLNFQDLGINVPVVRRDGVEPRHRAAVPRSRGVDDRHREGRGRRSSGHHQGRRGYRGCCDQHGRVGGPRVRHRHPPTVDRQHRGRERALDEAIVADAEARLKEVASKPGDLERALPLAQQLVNSVQRVACLYRRIGVRPDERDRRAPSAG